MNVNDYKSRERSKKRQTDYIKDDMARKEVTAEMTSNREILKKKKNMQDSEELQDRLIWNKTESTM